jgi:Ran GTPase-activating protein (RanGAP) involved in mRNA processing and transport
MPNYNEIFMTQFIQTLAQLSAGVVTAVFAVPVYSYYVKGNLFREYNEYNEEINDIKEKSSNVNHDDRSSDTDVEDNVEETETEQEEEL